MTDRPKVGFVGAGRVGKGLSLSLSRAGYEITGVAGRGQEQHVVDASEVVFLTVPDDSLLLACEKLDWEESKSAIHCSGAAELSVLAHAAEQGAQVGGFHPLQMFAGSCIFGFDGQRQSFNGAQVKLRDLLGVDFF